MEQTPDFIITRKLSDIIEQHEKNISWKKTGDIADRLDHVLSQYKQMTDNAISECRGLVADVKAQFKALEIIVEGLTSEGMNHGQKRVIANYLITMLRSFGDKLDNAKFEYDTQLLDRYGFFRTNTPERRLYEDRARLKHTVEQQEIVLKTLKEVHPDIYKSLHPDLPF